MANLEELNNICTQVRRDIVRMVAGAASGHPGGSLGCVEYFVGLYFEVLNHNPEQFNMNGDNEDLFFLSNGHISPVWYSTLARRGYFPVNELGTFRKLNSRLQGHPATKEKLPGIRIASGSLGQGLSAAIGAASAKKLNNDNSLVYCLMGDGEIQEGQVWEAAIYAGAKKIDNVIAAIDYNGKQIDGSTDDVMSLGNIKAKWAAFDWKVLEMDGNDMQSVLSVLSEAKSLSGNGQPIMIVMKTEMGQGVDYMMGTHKWHGNAPNAEQLETALNQLTETIGDY
jgi:transketolase